MKPESSPAIYLYCLVYSERDLPAAKIPAGLPGTGRPRILEGAGPWRLVVSDAPAAKYSKEKIEAGLHDLDWVAQCAVAHERIVEHFARTSTVIPMKLFTLFSSEQRAIAHILRMKTRLQRLLRTVQGCQEWGIRVRRDSAVRPSASTPPARRGSKSPTGTQFLLARKQQQDNDRLVRQRAAEDADAVYRSLAKSGKAARRLATVPVDDGDRLILDAAFLVSRKSQRRFQAAVQRVSKRFSGDYQVSLSGPWPPYNFIAELK